MNAKNQNLKLTVGIIGAGVMGSVFIDRLIKTKTFKKDHILVNDSNEIKLKNIKKQFGVWVYTKKKDLLQRADVVILAVKPQDFRALAEEIRNFANRVQIGFISIMAGVEIKTIQQELRIRSVIRAMPNMPARIGQGITVWKASSTANPKLKRCAKAIFQALGQEVEVKKEKYIDLATAVSGSGPGYVFLFQEIITNAGKELGLPKKIAEKLTSQTIKGSILLQQKMGVEPDILRKKVTSKGGTTEAALRVFKEFNLSKIFKRALLAALERSQQLKR